MTITLVSVDEFGAAYCVITRDDGSTFGQHFNDLPIEDVVAFHSEVQRMADEAVTRTSMPAVKKISPAVLANVGKRVGVGHFGPAQ